MIARVSVSSHRGGPHRPEDKIALTRDWIERVRFEKEKRGLSVRGLAELVRTAGHTKCSPAAIGKLLTPRKDGKPAQASSHLVPALCTVLGVPMPMVDNPELTEERDHREVALLEAFRKMRSDEQDHLLGLIAGMVKTR